MNTSGRLPERSGCILSPHNAAQAAQLLSIDLLDHVIIEDGRFVSLKEQGVM